MTKNAPPTSGFLGRRGLALAVVLVGAALTVIALRVAAWALHAATGDLGPTALDARVQAWVRGVRHERLTESLLQITALGGGTVLTLAVLLVVVALLLAGRRVVAGKVVLVSLGALIMIGVVKELVERPRPAVNEKPLDPWISVNSFSFPSGHSFAAMAVYLSLGLLVARLAPTRRCAYFLVLAAAGLALLVGATRVYLGAHYATDVIAGWFAGAAWTCACVAALWVLDPSTLRWASWRKAPCAE